MKIEVEIDDNEIIEMAKKIVADELAKKIFSFSYEGTFSDEPKIYIDSKDGCKYKKVLIIEE